jgi:DNA gyrase subunit B
MGTEVAATVLDAMRARPGMYVGNIHDGTGLAHLVWELVSNALDQHLAGRCTRIDVAVREDGAISVEDDGPGFSLFDAEGTPFAERALTQFHGAPSLDGHAPHEHVGAHGLGVFCVCALASELELDVHRAGTQHRQRFARGRALSAPEVIGSTIRSGTRILFQPDPLIFSNVSLDSGVIADRLRELASLIPTLTLTFRDDRTRVFHEPTGLLALLARSREGLAPVAEPMVVKQSVEKISVDAAIEWLPTARSSVESFANVQRTTHGGAHVRGLLDGLTAGLCAVIPQWRAQRKRATALVRQGLHAVVQVRLQDPSFGDPTTGVLSTPAARRAVRAAVQSAFELLLRGDETLRARFALR